MASVEENGAIQIMSVSIEGLESDGRLLLARERTANGMIAPFDVAGSTLTSRLGAHGTRQEVDQYVEPAASALELLGRLEGGRLARGHNPLPSAC